MLVELRRLVGTTRKRASYFEPLVRLAADPTRATIATLNYDRSIEGVGEAIGVPVHTGIASWVNTGRWDWPPSGVRLLKLHGSIEWAWEDDPSEPGHLPSRYIAEVAQPAHDLRPPAVVFGLRGKLRAEGPFLSALTEFESQLAGAPRLVVVGYSFRDDHVNQVIRRWTFEDRSRKIVVVDPYLPRMPPSRSTGMSFRDALLAYLINVKEGLGAETRIEVMREPASRALEQLFPEWTRSSTRTRAGETGSRRLRRPLAVAVDFSGPTKYAHHCPPVSSIRRGRGFARGVAADGRRRGSGYCSRWRRNALLASCADRSRIGLRHPPHVDCVLDNVDRRFARRGDIRLNTRGSAARDLESR